MRKAMKAFIRKFLREDRGQSAVVIAVMFTAITALAGSSVEAGHVYYAYQKLVQSTQAATLAGAQAMPNLLQASSNITQYSSKTNQLNYTNMLQNDSISANYYCSAAAKALNVQCQTPPTGEGSCTTGTTCNAVTVTQTAQVNLYFGGLIGMSKMNLTATSTAAMRGGTNSAYNIAVIIDTTASMASTAPSSDGCSGSTQIACAVSGLTTMLKNMDPCALNTTCSSSTAYVDGVSLFVFPPLKNTTANIAKDTACPTSNPTIVPYAFTNVTVGASTQNLYLPNDITKYPNNAGTYQVVGFEDTYKSNDSATTLKSGDSLAAAVGVGSGTCNGLQAPGGEGTYYAQVIYAAQQALAAQQIAYPGSKNIMIILSDGDSTACNSGGNTSAGACNSSDQLVALNCPAVNSSGKCVASSYTPCPSAAAGGCTGTPLNGTGTATTNAAGYQLATYPSVLGQCGQAVQAAQSATQAGTTVYTVAMGSATSGGCSSDKKYTISSGSTYGAVAWPSGSYSGQPCNAIGAMASNINTFFSDNTGGCPATGGNAVYTTIAGIFGAVTNNLTSARLIPPGT